MKFLAKVYYVVVWTLLVMVFMTGTVGMLANVTTDLLPYILAGHSVPLKLQFAAGLYITFWFAMARYFSKGLEKIEMKMEPWW